MSSDSLPRIVHDSFNVPDADIHLISQDNVVFQVYSKSLKLVSSFFESILSLPQPTASQDEMQTIHLDEDCSILEILLGIACGLPIGYSYVYRASLDLIEDVLRAADKYEIHAAIVYFRTLFTTAVANDGFPNETFSDPLRLYVICRRYEWYTETDRAFQRTLDINIFDRPYSKSLRRLNPSDLVDMLLLRKRRKDQLCAQLEDPSEFSNVMSISNLPLLKCRICYSTQTTMPVTMAWRDVRDRMMEEIERCPSGASLALDRSESPIHPLLSALNRSWTCTKCGSAYYDVGNVLQSLRRAVNRLPTRFEEPLL